MANIRWTSFVISSAITKSVVHFIPSAHATGAPYPAIFRLTIFSKELGNKSINLEGGRLGQPDGVRLEDIFPFIVEGVSGPIGIEIEITTSQPRVDLSASSCVIELTSTSQSVRFMATMRDDREIKERELRKKPQLETLPLIAFQDAMNYSTLLLVNTTDSAYQPFMASPIANSPEGALTDIPFVELGPRCAQEFTLNDKLFSELTPTEHSWGLGRARVLDFQNPLPPQVLAYAVYRDTLTKRIVSVSTL